VPSAVGHQCRRTARISPDHRRRRRVVTAGSADPGRLIPASTSGGVGASTPVLSLATLSPVRVGTERRADGEGRWACGGAGAAGGHAGEA